jgi:hypothetical protein
MEDEHFMVWMRTSALPTFRKLYGKIEDGLDKGEYVVRIHNNYNVKNFGGKKSIELTQLNALGGNNSYFAALYAIGAVLTFIFMIVSIYAAIKTGRTTSEKKPEISEPFI